MSASRLVILAASVYEISCGKYDEIPYDTTRYIYVRSKANDMASLV